MSIQAIEVEYKGHRFRSKTEAKWAVFFDQIGVRWEYEPQGFTFEEYSYLPDFYLPDRKMYVEIKRQDLDEFLKNHSRWLTFRKHIGVPFLALGGYPWFSEFHAMLVYRDQETIRAKVAVCAEMIIFRGMLYFAAEDKAKRQIIAIPFLRTKLSKGQLEIACRVVRQYRFTELW